MFLNLKEELKSFFKTGDYFRGIKMEVGSQDGTPQMEI